MSALSEVVELLRKSKSKSSDDLVKSVLSVRQKIETGSKLTAKETQIMRAAEKAGVPMMGKEFPKEQVSGQLEELWSQGTKFELNTPKQIAEKAGVNRYVKKRAGPKVAKDIRDYYDWKKSQTSLVPVQKSQTDLVPAGPRQGGEAISFSNKSEAKAPGPSWKQEDFPAPQYSSTAPSPTLDIPTVQQKNPMLKAGVAAAAGAGLVGSSTVMKSEGEVPEETMRRFDETPPPAEAKPPEQQAAESILAEAKQLGLRPTGGGVGPAEAPTRAAVKIPRYPTSKKQIEELDQKAQIARRGLSAEQAEFYDSQLDNIRTQAEDLFSRLEKTRLEEVEQKDRIDLIMGIAQGLEHIGHGFTRLFAANYGLKKGVDMSGIKFDKYDWATAQARFDKRFDRIISSIDSKMEKVITTQAEQTKSILEQKGKQEEELLKDARGFEAQSARLQAGEVAGEQARLIAQARLEDAALDRESRERMKAAELANRAMLASISDKLKTATTLKEKQQANTAGKIVAYDQILQALPAKGTVDGDRLAAALENARTQAAKSGLLTGYLVDLNEELRGFLRSGAKAEELRALIEAEQEALRNSLEQEAEPATAAPTPDPLNPEANNSTMSDEDIFNLPFPVTTY